MVADEKGHDGDDDTLEGHGFDESRQTARSERKEHRQQDQGQQSIDRMNHLTNSSVIMVAKNARANEVSTNWGTLSIRKRAMTDSVTPTAA